MYTSSLIQLFKTLDKNDRRQLKKVVRSPFFNTRADVIVLFDYIDKHLESGAIKMGKEKAFTAVFPKKAFDVDSFYYTMSHLHQLILRYLSINEFEKQTPQYQHSQNQALRQRGAEKIAERTLTNAKTTLERQTLRDAHYHYHNFQFRKESYNVKHRLKHTGDFELQEMTYDLHYYAITEILRNANSILSLQNVNKKDYHQPLLASTLLEAENYLTVSAIAVQYYSHKMLNGEDTEGGYFQKLKLEITQNQARFPENELRDLWFVAINFCIRRQNRGELSYAREALDLYRQGLESRVLMENNILSPYTYHNAVQLALKVQDFSWAQKFMEDSKHFLPDKERDLTSKHVLAIFYFRKNDYTQAMRLFQEGTPKDSLFNLDARRLLARIYYDLNEFSALDSHIESSKIYLHRQKEIGYGKEAYVNFFKILDKIRRNDAATPQSREILRGEVAEMKLLAEREWLLEKLK